MARITFAAVGTIGILAVDAMSSVKTRRALLTISVRVGVIHFYAQHFQRLDAPPEVIMISGVISIRTARVHRAFDRWLACAGSSRDRSPANACSGTACYEV